MVTAPLRQQTLNLWRHYAWAHWATNNALSLSSLLATIQSVTTILGCLCPHYRFWELKTFPTFLEQPEGWVRVLFLQQLALKEMSCCDMDNNDPSHWWWDGCNFCYFGQWVRSNGDESVKSLTVMNVNGPLSFAFKISWLTIQNDISFHIIYSDESHFA